MCNIPFTRTPMAMNDRTVIKQSGRGRWTFKTYINSLYHKHFRMCGREQYQTNVHDLKS